MMKESFIGALQMKEKNFGLLDDYAYLIDGLLHLYEVDLDSKILKWAVDSAN